MKKILSLISSKKLLIFDFDGTLADTSQFHTQAFYEVLHPLGIDFKYDCIAGLNTSSAFKKIFKHFSIPITDPEIEDFCKKKQEIVRSLISKNLNEDPNVKIFLDWAYHQEKYTMCIVSSGSRKTIECSINKLGMQSYFDFIICSEDVKTAKPSPEGFMLSLKKANFKNHDAIIFEDSEAGFEAAKSATIDFLDVTQNFWSSIITEL
jgi:beta-phosphoglucomutase